LDVFLFGDNKIINRDSIRLHKTLKLLENDTISLSPVDKYHAAMVLQHGNKPAHYKKAHELATNAAKHNIKNSKWLKKATYDRWQLSIGNKQKYGTQMK
jgi:hypothetical protein